MTGHLRIGYAQALILNVSTANQYLLHAVMQTVNEGSAREWSERQTLQYITEDFPEKVNQPSVIFATVDGKPVGCISFGRQGNIAPWIPSEDEYARLFIDTLYVEPEYRRQGIAKLLIRMAINEHFSTTAPICLYTTVGNEKALNLYHSIGFKTFSFLSAKSKPIKTVEELQQKYMSIKASFGGKTVRSRKIDLLDDQFILKLHGHGLKNICRGQHIFAWNDNDFSAVGMKWRRKYFEPVDDDGCQQLATALPVLTSLSDYQNIGIYINKELVGFYSMNGLAKEIGYLCIFPTDDETAANIARYAICDSIIQNLPWLKQHNYTGEYYVSFKPRFFFSYVNPTDKERTFWEDEGFTINGLAMLANRKTIEHALAFSDEQLKELPKDMQLCHAVATGQKPQNLPAGMTADDWLYLLAGTVCERGFWTEYYCKDLSIFDSNALTKLYVAEEISKETFFRNVNLSELTAENWARVIWNAKDYIPKCPARIWKQFTTALWETILGNSSFGEWHFGSLEELMHRLSRDNLRKFFQKHPSYVDKYPIVPSFYTMTPAWNGLKYPKFDREGVIYPELLKNHDHLDWDLSVDSNEEEELQEELDAISLK